MNLLSLIPKPLRWWPAQANSLTEMPPVDRGPVFVIGTGRSGTHWLGHSLGDHPEVRATIEVSPIFKLSTAIALNASLEASLLPELIRSYHEQICESAQRLYLDKSHPNIWIAEQLKQAFPKALFVGIERDPYATVASMKLHQGVAGWHERWREFPIPNRFLGITAELAERYDRLPRMAQYALRWAAHHNRMNELRDILGDDLLVISYETFARKTKETIRQLQRFLGLCTPIPIPDVKTASLEKWRRELSQVEIMQIAGVVDPPSSLKAAA